MSGAEFDIQIHIAGLDVQVGHQLRQRCAWCGAMLNDYNLAGMAFSIPPGKTEEQARADGDFKMPMWEVGALVARTDGGGVAYVVEHKDGDQLPPECCAQLAPEATA